MPKFFMPVWEGEKAEGAYAQIRAAAERNMGCKTSDRRILGVAFTHNGKDYYAEVGKIDSGNGETVFAIFEVPEIFAKLLGEAPAGRN